MTSRDVRSPVWPPTSKREFSSREPCSTRLWARPLSASLYKHRISAFSFLAFCVVVSASPFGTQRPMVTTSLQSKFSPLLNVRCALGGPGFCMTIPSGLPIRSPCAASERDYLPTPGAVAGKERCFLPQAQTVAATGGRNSASSDPWRQVGVADCALYVDILLSRYIVWKKKGSGAKEVPA